MWCLFCIILYTFSYNVILLVSRWITSFASKLTSSLLSNLLLFFVHRLQDGDRRARLDLLLLLLSVVQSNTTLRLVLLHQRYFDISVCVIRNLKKSDRSEEECEAKIKFKVGVKKSSHFKVMCISKELIINHASPLCCYIISCKNVFFQNFLNKGSDIFFLPCLFSSLFFYLSMQAHSGFQFFHLLFAAKSFIGFDLN